jgi:hypothetical protein
LVDYPFNPGQGCDAQNGFLVASSLVPPTSFGSTTITMRPTLAAGSTHYLRAHVCDNAGNCVCSLNSWAYTP